MELKACDYLATSSLPLSLSDFKISLYICYHLKNIQNNFTFIIRIILELFTNEFCIFFKRK